MYCFSTSVHEEPEVVINQIDNIHKYLPNTYIILHISLMATNLREPLFSHYKNSESVFINPHSYPTAWGWMFHSILANYLYAKDLNLNFDSFIVDTSNSLYFKKIDTEHINNHDFLSSCGELEVMYEKYGSQWTDLLVNDEYFYKILKEEGIKQCYTSTHEGSAFKKELFDEMLAIYIKYYKWDLNEYRYAREDFYLPTIARHLSSNVGNRLTLFVAHKQPWEEVVADLKDHKGLVDGKDGTKLQYFGVKPVPRKIDSPLRQFINTLDSQGL